jgi:hypothetical protein
MCALEKIVSECGEQSQHNGEMEYELVVSRPSCVFSKSTRVNMIWNWELQDRHLVVRPGNRVGFHRVDLSQTHAWLKQCHCSQTRPQCDNFSLTSRQLVEELVVIRVDSARQQWAVASFPPWDATSEVGQLGRDPSHALCCSQYHHWMHSVVCDLQKMVTKNQPSFYFYRCSGNASSSVGSGSSDAGTQRLLLKR